MIEFILNDREIQTDLPAGMTVLDFVRYRENLKGTKIGCREGDCGACTILVGELIDEAVRYRSMTSCLMPLANAAGKHIVTIEGINPADGSLTPVQQAMVDESGTQCGFCTVGFVMSLTGFCLGTPASTDAAVSSVDGNICRCTGYKSIERAAEKLCNFLSEPPASAGGQSVRVCVPTYFVGIGARLSDLNGVKVEGSGRPVTQAVLTGGGTDLYVQTPEFMMENESRPLLYVEELRAIRDLGDTIQIGASATVTDLLESPLMQSVFPNLYKHLKLVSSTPIRNMATLAGNFVNASPIGDMTVWFLALDAEIELQSTPRVSEVKSRTMRLKDLYAGYKKLVKDQDEIITTIRFRKPGADFFFNFEKVCKRTYLDIATVNTAISLRVETAPGAGWTPPALSEPPASAGGQKDISQAGLPIVDHFIVDAHVAAGGVAPIPFYLKEASSFLIGRKVDAQTINKANDIIQAEISPISDVRGTEAYKRLLLRQLFYAHFYELFGVETKYN